ncbi:protein-methionine-sulfoxide reductase catalytic subunit MsrP [Atopomonas sediminilitoris]|uniref:protein-methionine-sulfoxide reductase catalytic subunit MsrP n=1 Tax=Atopomonas sediminilitoris TaxID=2919919 RepID=UPI001F4EE382|nr:protein-methionine-sulfoxide reductase catalytic subunit MsrP [Atopomonas sediminilitoris]MCJ8169931.1 protein-methionine-sulfoxide reductase catalytic subunit MsrP [Atopomonas sediminilitoris]
MLLKTSLSALRWSAPEHHVTDEKIYLNRRAFLQAGIGASLVGVSSVVLANPYRADGAQASVAPAWFQQKADAIQWRAVATDEALTPFNDAARYNNFYEFGTDKGDPARLAQSLQPEPWSVLIDGAVAKPGKVGLEDLLAPHALQERIYRLRCVEAWSMVIPWLGIPLADILKRVEPTAKAKYVRFETLVDPEQMPAQRSAFGLIKWPYVEGLRIDEAMHPLTILAVGMYGRVLPKQNGAPLRLVVPWKYGFKSIKSIVRISLLEKPPRTTWQSLAPDEYGFYANVNPAVSHPRWSQASERRLPSSLFNPNRMDTQPFNGYADEVASLYGGMDLAVHY